MSYIDLAGRLIGSRLSCIGLAGRLIGSCLSCILLVGGFIGSCLSHIGLVGGLIGSRLSCIGLAGGLISRCLSCIGLINRLIGSCLSCIDLVGRFIGSCLSHIGLAGGLIGSRLSRIGLVGGFIGSCLSCILLVGGVIGSSLNRVGLVGSCRIRFAAYVCRSGEVFLFQQTGIVKGNAQRCREYENQDECIVHRRQERRDIERRKVHEESHDCAKNQGLIFDGAAKENGNPVKQEDAHCHDGSSKQEKRQYLSPRFISVNFPAYGSCAGMVGGTCRTPDISYFDASP